MVKKSKLKNSNFATFSRKKVKTGPTGAKRRTQKEYIKLILLHQLETKRERTMCTQIEVRRGGVDRNPQRRLGQPTAYRQLPSRRAFMSIYEMEDSNNEFYSLKRSFI